MTIKLPFSFGPLVFAMACAFGLSAQTHTGWKEYGGATDAAQFSALTQINKTNVAQLEVAWVYPTGDKSKYFFNPIVIDNLMYVLAKNNSLVALDAKTGKEVWVHPADPHTTLITNRGINYWESKDRSDRRLIYAANNLLRELDARTGNLITTFGKQGYVDLREGFGRDVKTIPLVQSTTPGRVFGDLLILGSATNQGYGSAPGDIRAFNVRTGELQWTFHTIPHPGEFGYETWPAEAWKTAGGANTWGEISLDEKRGIVYLPTASPKYNFYGVDRKGSNLFGDCLLALDARTGKRLWHFQMVHHDIWDYDANTAPKLLTVKHDGKSVDIVALVSKQGFLWVFDRVTGKPLWPIEERPVPKSDMPGEETWPTQPFPVKPPPFARQKFTVDDLSPYIEDPQERARFRDEILSARNEGLFTPPGTRKTIEMPGNNGGANWGGSAVDPRNGTLYVVSKDLPAMLKLEPETNMKRSATDTPEQRGQYVYEAKCQSCHRADRGGQPPMVPSLTEAAARFTRDQISGVVRSGQGPMPAFANLSTEDMNALLDYLANPARAAATVPSNAAATKESSAEPQSKTRYYSAFGFMITRDGVSPIAPPWTSLTAYDLNEGTIKWKIPLGEVPSLAAKGIHNTGSHYPKVGPVVTAGGLIFAGTRDQKVHALDADNGKVLWERPVDSAVEGMPAVYEIDGKQYIVFCASAQAAITQMQQSKIQGAYVAFALPSK